jgi:hypothetical protein
MRLLPVIYISSVSMVCCAAVVAVWAALLGRPQGRRGNALEEKRQKRCRVVSASH